MKPRALILLALCAAATPLAAQTMWRCGADGRSFSDRPCPEGRPLTVAAGVPTAAVAEAEAVAAYERQALQALAGERKAREAEARARGYGPGAIRTVAQRAEPEKKHKRKAKRKPWEAPTP